ncbi:hypothetical protein V2A60_004528 [Cordyceps javanica]
MTSSIPKLRVPKTWDEWFHAPEIYAKSLHIWENVDPATDDDPDDTLIKPTLPIKESVTHGLI